MTLASEPPSGSMAQFAPFTKGSDWILDMLARSVTACRRGMSFALRPDAVFASPMRLPQSGISALLRQYEPGGS